jgi:hypothetical protein
MTETVTGQGNAGGQNGGGHSAPAPVGRQAIRSVLIVVFGVLFYGGLAIIVAAVFGNQWARGRLTEIRDLAYAHPYWLMGGIALLIVGGFLSYWFHTLLRSLPEDTRRTTVGFLAVLLILLGTVTIVFLGVGHRRFAIQIAFFLVASLLPGALYYLFLRTRRPSILNEFTMNLWRLGLLVARYTYLRQGAHVVLRVETRDDVVARVDSYFQKFEAVYGALRFESSSEGPPITRTTYVEAILVEDGKPMDRRRLIQPTVRLADILTANIFIPLGFATFLSALGWLLVLEPQWVAGSDAVAAAATEKGGRLDPVATPLNFAFLGAYFFGLQALFRRFVRRDLGPNAFLSFSNRIVLATIGVWVIGACFAIMDTPRVNEAMSGAPISKEQGLLVVAFVLGVFPRTLWQVITAALTKLTYVKWAVPSVEAKQPLDHLDGLTIWHESRLEEEDIENVPNMATADMVDLVLHTQIPAERLVDWIDQAILYKALGPDPETDLAKTRRGRLRTDGIRTATQIVRVYTNATDAERKALEKSLGSDDVDVLRTVTQAIQIESNWDYVAAWRNVEGPPAHLKDALTLTEKPGRPKDQEQDQQQKAVEVLVGGGDED